MAVGGGNTDAGSGRWRTGYVSRDSNARAFNADGDPKPPKPRRKAAKKYRIVK
jgi:hypothetical protein